LFTLRILSFLEVLGRVWISERAQSEKNFLHTRFGNGHIDNQMPLNETPRKILTICDIIPINLFAPNK
jgi:hypothetical protein